MDFLAGAISSFKAVDLERVLLAGPWFDEELRSTSESDGAEDVDSIEVPLGLVLGFLSWMS